MFGITTRRFLGYTFLPGFSSRLSNLTAGGFYHVAYLLAIVYNMVRLLPDNHPYLQGRNFGRYGVRHVISEAANNLVFSRQNIDKIVLFFIVLVGMGLLIMQFLVLIMSVFMLPAMAGAWPPAPAWPPVATDWWSFFFVADNPRNDIAYILLDLVFGIPDPASALPIGGGSFFGSCVGSGLCLDIAFPPAPIPNIDVSHPDVAGILGGTVTAATHGPLANGAFVAFPFPIHFGMQVVFGMYNTGLLFVAVVISSYFIVTVIAETAQSGTPFGKRFNKLWAPLRIVVAFGLLVPFGAAALGGGGGPAAMVNGMNAAQYIVLYAAKYGSAFATRGWTRFSETLTTTPLNGNATNLISTPNAPAFEDFAIFMWLVKVCEKVHLVENNGTAVVFPFVIGRADKLPVPVLQLASGTSYGDVLDFLDATPQNITIRFGERSDSYPKEDGNVKSLCGDIQIPITDGRKLTTAPQPASPGVYAMQNLYYNFIRDTFYESGGIHDAFSAGEVVDGGGGSRPYAFAYKSIHGVFPAGANRDLTTVYTAGVLGAYRLQTKLAIAASAILHGTTDASWLVGPCANGAGSTLQGRGWAAAGIWYNCIAELNGSFTSAVGGLPKGIRYPDVMEKVASAKAKYDKSNPGAMGIFELSATGVLDVSTQMNNGEDFRRARILYDAGIQWSAGSITSTKLKEGNVISSAIVAFFGANGLYDMRSNANIHPLAQIVGIGRSLVEAAIRNLQLAAGATVLNMVLQGAGGGILGLGASILITVSMLGLTAGFVLFYVVPFLPFLYFYFAVGGWIKAVFEAIVGAPLWALAHIRIDGHGLPGNAALNGYFLIFEIFLRPILTLFGLLASVSIFAAMVLALNTVFDLVVHNVSGFDIEQDVTGPAADSVASSMRGSIDEFFYTVLYAVIVYMMGMSSFKLIDQIPNQILRWMGQSVPTFGDTREDPIAGLMGRASMGVQQVGGKLGGGLSGVVGAANKYASTPKS